MTHYDILGVAENSSFEEIKKAYREMALLYHPDVNKMPDAHYGFIVIKEAYEVLSNTEKRRMYDGKLELDRLLSNPKKESKSKEKEYFVSTKEVFLFPVIFIIFVFALILILSNLEENKNKTTEDFVSRHDSGRESVKESLDRPEEDFSNSIYSDIPASQNNSVKFDTKSPIEYVNRNYKEKNKDYSSSNNQTYKRPENGDSPYIDYYGYGKIDKSSLSEITIINGSSQDAVVLIYDSYSKDIVRNVYVREGKRYTIKKMREGLFKMRCFYGDGWNPEKNNGHGNPIGGFMNNIIFTDMAGNENFNMYREETIDGINYPTYSVTLHKVINGNLHTKNISQSDFF